MSTLPLYWKLSSPADAERLSASVDLISSIERFQTEYTPEDAAEPRLDAQAVDLAAQIDAATSEDVKYALRRLTRGLASPKESSRLGFAVALTELLGRLSTVTAGHIIYLVKEASEITGGTKGQLLRDMLFARLFGFNCLVESGLLFKTHPLPFTSNPPATLNDFQAVLKELIKLGEQKTWLREPGWWAVTAALKGLAESAVLWKNEAVDHAVTLIFRHSEDWTPEKLAVALQMQRDFPNVDWRKVLSPTFEDGQMLALSSLRLLATTLKETPEDENDDDGHKAPVAANWKPQPHFAWDVIIQEYVNQPQAGSGDPQRRSSIHDFFRIVVDESLFGVNASPESKFWGFEVFRKVIACVEGADLPPLFTKNFMRTWMSHLSGRDKMLHKAARQVADDIKATLEKNKDVGFSLVMALLGATDGQFDRITNSKTVESILGSMDVAGVKDYVGYLIDQAYGEQTDAISERDALNSKRLWVIEQLSAMIRSPAIPRSDEWIWSALQFLLLHGFFTVKKKTSHSDVEVLQRVISVPPTREVHAACRQHLYTCLAHLSTIAHGKGRPNDNPQSTATQDALAEVSWPSKSIDLLTALEGDTKHVTLLSEESEDIVSLRKKARKFLKGISDNSGRLAAGLRLHLYSFLLRSYDELFESLDAFEESIEAASDLLKTKSLRRKKNDLDPAESDPEAIDVIVDTLIGDLEKGSLYERDVAHAVFDLICGSLKDSTVELLLTQIAKRDPLPNENEDSEDEDMESDAAEAEAASEPESSSSASQGEGGNEVESDEEVDPEFRKRIAEALQANGVHENGNEHVDPDETSDSEDDELLMNDDQMMALDEKLAEIFRSARGGKSERQGAQRQATVFKTRVVDFVEIFTKRNPSSEHIPRILMSLIELATGSSTDEGQLKQKVIKVIRSGIGQIKDFAQDIDTSAVAISLKNVHTSASKTHTPEVASIFIPACHYLIRNLLHAGAEQLVSDVYTASLEDVFTKKRSTFPIKILEDFLKNHNACAWSLRSRIVDFCKSDVATNARRQVQAVGLIKDLVQTRSTTELLNFIPSFAPAVVAIFSDQTTAEVPSMTTSELRDLSQSLLAIIRRSTSKGQTSEATGSLWNLHGQLSSKITIMQSTPRVKSSAPLNRTLDNILQLIGGGKAESAGKKRKKTGDHVVVDAEEADQIMAETKEKKKKRKKVDQAT